MLRALPQSQDLSEINNPRKASQYVHNPELERIYRWLRQYCPGELIHQLEVAGRGYRDVFGFYEFLGGVFVWPHDFGRGCEGLRLISDTNTAPAPFIETLKSAAGKYPDFEEPPPSDIRRAILLPGTEILRYLVSKETIVQYAKGNGAYIKPHPITTLTDLEMLRTLGVVLPPTVSANNLVRSPGIEIMVSSCSTLAIQAKLNGKLLRSLDASRVTRHYCARYERFAPYLYGDVSEHHLINILSNPLSGYLHPGVATEQDVRDFFSFYMDISVSNQPKETS